eukprot:3213247-Alexandrium_andersonii.AAC.1
MSSASTGLRMHRTRRQRSTKQHMRSRSCAAEAHERNGKSGLREHHTRCGARKTAIPPGMRRAYSH